MKGLTELPSWNGMGLFVLDVNYNGPHPIASWRALLDLCALIAVKRGGRKGTHYVWQLGVRKRGRASRETFARELVSEDSYADRTSAVEALVVTLMRFEMLGYLTHRGTRPDAPRNA